MSAPKVGDRVRAAFEAIYYGLADGRHVVKISNPRGSVLVALPDDADVEILHPPVKVGDVIETAEELDALPVGAAVKPSARCVAERNYSGWYFTGVQTNYATADVDLPATVLYLPDGAA